MRILLVRGDAASSNLIEQQLDSEQYSVTVCWTGEEGFYLAQTEAFDLLVLDDVLPGRDGLEILQTLRSLGTSTPIILLTSDDAPEARIRALNAGADDCLPTPFSVVELLARVRAILRRGPLQVGCHFRLGDLEMNVMKRTVLRSGRILDLTLREFELLEHFFINMGRIVTREMLARDVWKARTPEVSLNNVIDAQIARLRRKVDEGFDCKLLHTVRGVGFTLREEESRELRTSAATAGGR